MSTSYKKSWFLCLSGAHNAIARVDSALAAKETDAKVLQPLAESLWWVCAADESLKTEYKNQWKKHLRPILPELPLLEGLHWARNRVTHQICHWEMARPPLLWEDAEILAPSGNVQPQFDHGRAEYVSHLQGNDAREAVKLVVKGIRSLAVGSLPP